MAHFTHWLGIALITYGVLLGIQSTVIELRVSD
jgi:hypothetical protein